MSLSPFVSFQSRFVTYLLTYPRIMDLLDLGASECFAESENVIVKYFEFSGMLGHVA